MVRDFAKLFGQHPDTVFVKTSFDTVTKILLSLQKEGEFQDRYQEIERMMNATTTQ